jgi:hypothetical protein
MTDGRLIVFITCDSEKSVMGEIKRYCDTVTDYWSFMVVNRKDWGRLKEELYETRFVKDTDFEKNKNTLREIAYKGRPVYRKDKFIEMLGAEGE